jgi:hypothetical protein
MPAPTVPLRPILGEYVVARLPAATDVTALLHELVGSALLSITRTDQELSIVCEAGVAPAGAEIDGPWRALYASGPMPFGLTGVVSSLVEPLARIGCPVFVTSTFDGDVLMVPSEQHAAASEALMSAGHLIDAPTPG